MDTQRNHTLRLKGIPGSIYRILSPEFRYALVLFLVTRLVLTPLMVGSRVIGRETSRFASLAFVNFEPVWLGIWGMWDSAWYLDIAKNWYSPGIRLDIWHYNQANYGFFPLYPLFMRLVGTVIGDYFIAGLIISNLALLVSCALLYRLVAAKYDKDTAYRSIKYLFFFPSAFMLSAVLSESLALALILASFYFSSKGSWLKASLAGFLLALTKPYGFLIMLPLLLEYYRKNRFKAKLRAACLIIIPAGLLLFMSYTYLLTGDFLAYVHIKQDGWGHQLSNPLSVIVAALFEPKASYVYNSLFTIAIILVIMAYHRRIGASYSLFALLFIFAPLASGGRGMLQCMTRYALLVFPLFIILATLTKDKKGDIIASITLSMLQLLLILYWSTGSGVI